MQIFNLKKIFFCSIFFFAFLSCKKSMSGSGNIPPGIDIYIIGPAFSEDSTMVWHNGDVTYISGLYVTGNTNTPFSNFYGNDLYVWGRSELDYQSIYSKNGALNNLYSPSGNYVPGSLSFISDMFISGTDVYATGSQGLASVNLNDPNVPGVNVAEYWKNGVATYLANDSIFSEANSVFVSGSDVYVAGAVNFYKVPVPGGFENDFNYTATIWKNGIPTYLTNSSVNSIANLIQVVGSDVYILGTTGNAVTTLWKNGTPAYFADSLNILSMLINSNDIYLTGYASVPGGSISSINATYIKNGVQTILPAPNTSRAYQTYVIGNDVYTGGAEYNNLGLANSNQVATIWKNGVALQLPNPPIFPSSVTLSIIIK